MGRIEMPPASPSDQPDWPEGVWCSTWTPDSARLLLCADGEFFAAGDGNLLVVDTETWKPTGERISIGGEAQTVELSPDGRLFAVGMAVPDISNPPPGEVKLFDATTFELQRVLTIGPGERPYDATFSPDGTMLATGGMLGELAVFDVATGRPLHAPVQAHQDFLGQAEWLPDNRTVVTTGADGMIALYDAQRGLIRATMPASAAGGSGYTYLTSVSATEVIAASRDRPARSYPLESEHWLAHACAVAGRDLTQEEWGRYLGDRPYQQTCGNPG
jgi:WD40 repeat protein